MCHIKQKNILPINTIFYVLLIVLLFVLSEQSAIGREIKVSSLINADQRITQVGWSKITENLSVNDILIIDCDFYIDEEIIISHSVRGDEKHIIYTTGKGKILINADKIIVESLIINGGTAKIRGHGIIANYVKNLQISNCDISDVEGPGVHLQTVEKFLINSNKICNTFGLYGDGILMLNCLEGEVLHNHCSKFQRIGIVSDWSEERKSKNILIYGNICKDAIQSIRPEINGGIWVENTLESKIIRNEISNTISKGIVVAPDTENIPSYHLIEKNFVSNCFEGLNVTFAKNQTIDEKRNRFLDVINIVEISEPKVFRSSGTIFESVDSVPKRIYFLLPSKNPTGSTIEILKSKNKVKSKGLVPVEVGNVFGISGDLSIKDCEGNFAVKLSENSLNGCISISKCKLDYSDLRSDFISNSKQMVIENCNILLPPNRSMKMQGENIEFKSCSISSEKGDSEIHFGTYGATKLLIANSSISKVKLSSIIRPETKMEFDRVYIKMDRSELFDSDFQQNKGVVIKNMKKNSFFF
ncbi:right-handed parallel beta-helix repeat-containing protein [Sphingobacterium corticis]|uniref:Right-handed parallel beta-helix repeat-containing protein n=1 Tax=Sphingobacterium corticis TaxID=1812823 RepID=A0ABW5NG48_9SPHI